MWNFSSSKARGELVDELNLYMHFKFNFIPLSAVNQHTKFN